MKIRSLSYLLGFLVILPSTLFSDEEDRNRGGIEEITVTAEKELQLFQTLQCLLQPLILHYLKIWVCKVLMI